jgi:hypothetical protein
MPRFRKKPIEIEAEQYLGPNLVSRGQNLPNSPFGVLWAEMWDGAKLCPYIVTIHGQKTFIECGDWIITEPDGVHHYPCKPDIFKDTYDPL